MSPKNSLVVRTFDGVHDDKNPHETDSFGSLEVPADKYWGAQTQRSIRNFPIGWEKQPVTIVRALGVIKQACAEANKDLGKLDADLADAIIQASSEVASGKFDDNFPSWSGRQDQERNPT